MLSRSISALGAAGFAGKKFSEVAFTKFVESFAEKFVKDGDVLHGLIDVMQKDRSLIEMAKSIITNRPDSISPIGVEGIIFDLVTNYLADKVKSAYGEASFKGQYYAFLIQETQVANAALSYGPGGLLAAIGKQSQIAGEKIWEAVSLSREYGEVSRKAQNSQEYSQAIAKSAELRAAFKKADSPAEQQIIDVQIRENLASGLKNSGWSESVIQATINESMGALYSQTSVGRFEQLTILIDEAKGGGQARNERLNTFMANNFSADMQNAIRSQYGI